MNKAAQILTRTENHPYVADMMVVKATTPDGTEMKMDYSLTLSPAQNHKRAAIRALEALGCTKNGVIMQSAFDTDGTLWEVT